jgi:hypothetical protein
MRNITILILIICCSIINAIEIEAKIDNRSKRYLDLCSEEYELIESLESYHEIKCDSRVFDDLEQRNFHPEMLEYRIPSGYHSYNDIVTELENISVSHASITSLSSLGPTTCHQYYLDGNNEYSDFQHNIWCLKISDNPEVEEDEPNLFIGGGIHARELISVEVALNLMNHIIENYDSDPEIRDLVDNNQLWFMPLMNPDGHKLVFDEVNVSHRKSLTDNNGNGIPESYEDGVDLNRNFGYVWGSNGTSDDPTNNIYHGTHAWSEIETCYFRDLLTERKFVGGITYHSRGQYVLYPLGHIPGAFAKDHEIMHDLAVEMAEMTPRIDSAGHYDARQAVNFGYTCQGTMGDWGYAEERLFNFTVELADEFIPEEVEEICQDNLDSGLLFLNRAKQSILTGHVRNIDGEPLEAIIQVSEIDNQTGMSEIEPYKSHPMFGRFTRPLLPGNYELIVSCEDYVSKTFTDIEIFESEPTELEIVLEKVIHYGDVDDNNEVEAYDAAFVLQYSVGIDPIPEIDPIPWEDERIIRADVDQNNLILAYDAALILKHVVGLIDSFPVTQSTESLTPEVELNNGILTINAKNCISLNLKMENSNITLGNIEFSEDVFYEEFSDDYYNMGLIRNSNEESDLIVSIPIDNVSSDNVQLTIIANNSEYLIDIPTTENTDNILSPMVDFNIYPNPFNTKGRNSLTLSFSRETKKNALVTLYNLKGQFVKEEKIETGSKTHSFSLETEQNSITNGIYFIRFSEDKFTSVKKVIVLK